jgi:hypothetical protein
LRGWTVEQSDSVFAVVVADLTELVENPGSERFGYFLVAYVNRLEIIPSGLSTHVNVTLSVVGFSSTYLGYILYESTYPPKVTF